MIYEIIFNFKSCLYFVFLFDKIMIIDMVCEKNLILISLFVLIIGCYVYCIILIFLLY